MFSNYWPRRTQSGEFITNLSFLTRSQSVQSVTHYSPPPNLGNFNEQRVQWLIDGAAENEFHIGSIKASAADSEGWNMDAAAQEVARWKLPHFKPSGKNLRQKISPRLFRRFNQDDFHKSRKDSPNKWYRQQEPALPVSLEMLNSFTQPISENSTVQLQNTQNFVSQRRNIWVTALASLMFLLISAFRVSRLQLQIHQSDPVCADELIIRRWGGNCSSGEVIKSLWWDMWWVFNMHAITPL